MRLTAQIHLMRDQVRVLVTSQEQGDVLKASLSQRAAHPRALLTLLEGLALWSGATLCAAITVEPNCPSWAESELFGDALWPGESQLVRYDVVVRGRPKRLRGLGDFREIRACGRGAR